MKQITAVIPTLLKDVQLLNKLIESLVDDSSVAEIIVINNSENQYSFNNDKVRILSDGTNHFVNPS